MASGCKFSLEQLKDALIFIRNINGQEYWAISMGMSAISYVSVSLLGKSSSFNMDKLLNRGEYAVEGESKISQQRYANWMENFSYGGRIYKNR